jgi:hypothetical protein
MKKRTANALFYLAVTVAALWLNSTFAYSAMVEQWRPAVDEACAVYGCSTDYILGVIDCESGGDPSAVSEIPNPENGTHDYGLLQVNDYLWDGSSMGPVEQIWFAAEHLTAGTIWWACG